MKAENSCELTFKAFLLGILLSALLAAANAYLGLKVGMTVSASIPAAVLSLAVLRLFRHSSMLENNLVQTAASAGESLAAGVIFTIPALLILGYWDRFNYMEITLIAGAGGILGVLFSIPLRRILIVESKLTFPEGIATAEVLKAGDRGSHGIKGLIVGCFIGGAVKLGQTGLRVLTGAVHGSVSWGSGVFGLGADLSPALLGVGYIVRLNIAVLVFAGSSIAWFIAIPAYLAIKGSDFADDVVGYELAFMTWSSSIRYLGVGAMVVGGLWTLIVLLRPLLSAARNLIDHKVRENEERASVNRDIPKPAIVGGLVMMTLLLGWTFKQYLLAPELDATTVQVILVLTVSLFLVLLAGFLFSAVAGYMAGLVGSSNNPVSGVTIATILFTSSVIYLLVKYSRWPVLEGAEGLGYVSCAAAAILVGAAVCCAAAISGDNLQDLKAGYIIGAVPYRQQIMQLVGVVAAAAVLAPVLGVLYDAYGIAGHFPRPGMDPTQSLAAPQATLMASVAQGVFEKNLKWSLIGIGALVAVVVIVLDEILKARNIKFRTPVLAVAVGIYLPIELTFPIFIGGLLAYLAHRDDNNHGPGLLIASGLIAGEAIMGVLLAIPFAITQDTGLLHIAGEGFERAGRVLGVLVFSAVAVWLFFGARRRGPQG